MANLTPIRDAGGKIIRLVPRDEAPGASTLFAETMAAVGAAPEPAAPEEDTRSSFRFGRVELAATVAGLILAGVLILLVSRALPAGDARQPAQPSPAPAVAPAATPAPEPTEAPTAAPTATAMPAIPTATEAPTPEPQVIYVPVAPPCDPNNPPFVVEQDVFDGSTPIGHVIGTSCESQADARANADALAAQMKGVKP